MEKSVKEIGREKKREGKRKKVFIYYFSIFFLSDSLLYFLLAFKYYFVRKKSVKEIGREKKRKKVRGERK
jgi:heme/copper-type cytochrome/quinol oxidase subunit 3